MHGNRESRENLVPQNFTPLKVMPMMLDLKVPQTYGKTMTNHDKLNFASRTWMKAPEPNS